MGFPRWKRRSGYSGTEARSRIRQAVLPRCELDRIEALFSASAQKPLLRGPEEGFQSRSLRFSDRSSRFSAGSSRFSARSLRFSARSSRFSARSSRFPPRIQALQDRSPSFQDRISGILGDGSFPGGKFLPCLGEKLHILLCWLVPSWDEQDRGLEGPHRGPDERHLVPVGASAGRLGHGLRQVWRSSALEVAAPRVVLSKMHQTVRPVAASAWMRAARTARSSPE